MFYRIGVGDFIIGKIVMIVMLLFFFVVDDNLKKVYFFLVLVDCGVIVGFGGMVC